MNRLPRVTDFARAAAPAFEEMIAMMPQEDRERCVSAVSAGARLALGLEMDGQGGSVVVLTLIDREGLPHRMATVRAQIPERH